ncbi:hypothetical protein FHT03_000172 [Xanthomonas arboricola]
MRNEAYRSSRLLLRVDDSSFDFDRANDQISSIEVIAWPPTGQIFVGEYDYNLLCS